MKKIKVKTTIGKKGTASYWEGTTVCQVSESITEAVERVGEDAVLRKFNAGEKQDAVQGPKQGLRDAADKFGIDSAEFKTAKAEYDKLVIAHVYTGKRTTGDGITQKAGQAATRRLTSATANLDDNATMTVAEIKAMLAEEGIPVA